MLKSAQQLGFFSSTEGSDTTGYGLAKQNSEETLYTNDGSRCPFAYNVTITQLTLIEYHFYLLTCSQAHHMK